MQVTQQGFFLLIRHKCLNVYVPYSDFVRLDVEGCKVLLLVVLRFGTLAHKIFFTTSEAPQGTKYLCQIFVFSTFLFPESCDHPSGLSCDLLGTFMLSICQALCTMSHLVCSPISFNFSANLGYEVVSLIYMKSDTR